VGEAVGKAFAVMASAVEDLPKVMGRDDVCKESFGRLLGAGCCVSASISLVVLEYSDDRLFGLSLTPCVESAGAIGFIARASMSNEVFLWDKSRPGQGGACGAVGREDGFTVRLVG
jgi:hypothetical protein